MMETPELQFYPWRWKTWEKVPETGFYMERLAIQTP